MPRAEPRPSFDPTWPEVVSFDTDGWLPVVQVEVQFSLDVFFQVLATSFVLHPEINSSSILRADILFDSIDSNDHPGTALNDVKGKAKSTESDEHTSEVFTTRRIRRRLLPKAIIDAPLDQDCFFRQDADGLRGELELLPLLDATLSEEEQEASVPFYHPRVKSLLIRYRPCHVNEGSDSPEIPQQAFVDVCVRSFPSVSLPLDPASRLARTSLALLRVVHLHCVTRASSGPYTKRSHHDRLVSRETYQDLYLELKQKYLWVLGAWKENTDPKKHVFEDVGIASWLMCLWRRMYPEVQGKDGRESWGQPPGGFVDVGCGNGLLCVPPSSWEAY